MGKLARIAISEPSKEREEVATALEEEEEQILSVYTLPEKHRRRMRSTNMLEK